MSKWFLACRPHTLTVSVAPVLMGSAMAYSDGGFHALSFAVVLLCAVLIQVGTNLCNDYFDFLKGADTHERLGPARATQSGWVTPAQIRNAFVGVFALACVLGSYLVYRGGWPVLIVGVLAILSGILYTAGPFSLAYLGVSEIFVVVFFGPIAVAGTYYVQTLQFSSVACVAGLAPGFLSTAILVLNNLRDREQDQRVHKKTLAVRLGDGFARLEYVFLVILAALVPVWLWQFMNVTSWVLMSSFIVILFTWPICRQVLAGVKGRTLNGLLAKTGKSVLIFGIIFSLGYLL